jgi:O-acetylhomoserine (thiol)-lyase
MKRETIAIHAGYDGDPTTKAVAVPIYQTVAFEFDSAEHGAALFNLEVQGNIYTRIGNPTNTVLEKRVAALEGGVDGSASAPEWRRLSIRSSISPKWGITLFPPRSCTAPLTHSWRTFFRSAESVRVSRKTDRPEDVEKLIDENTRAVYCESVGNPAGNVADIEGLARVAHKHGVPLVVDNTVATPILLRPIEYGADVVVHSMTKFIGGGGTSIGGMIVDSGKFPVAAVSEKFYMFNVPEMAYHGVVYVDHSGTPLMSRDAVRCVSETPAPRLSPFNGFLFLQGIQTLALRVERHVENARKVAEFLRDHPMVEWVNYVGFPDNPLYPMAHRYLGSNFCSLLTFGVKGGYEVAGSASTLFACSSEW